MKASADFLWVIFLLLALLTIMLSRVDCIRYVTTSVEQEIIVGEITSLPLPDPDYYNAFEWVLRLSLLSAALLLLRNTALNVFGNIIALVQVLVMLFLDHVVDLANGIFDTFGCTGVIVQGHWEYFAIYYIITVLSVVMFAYSVFLTCIRIACKKKSTQPKQTKQMD